MIIHLTRVTTSKTEGEGWIENPISVNSDAVEFYEEVGVLNEKVTALYLRSSGFIQVKEAPSTITQKIKESCGKKNEKGQQGSQGSKKRT